MDEIQKSSVIVFLIFLIWTSGMNAQKVFYAKENELWAEEIPDPNAEPVYSIYLIGDLKYPIPLNDNLALLQRHLEAENDQSTLVVLGDIVYPLGLPDPTDPLYAEALAKHEQVLEVVRSFSGEIVFIPGNHDWARGRSDGWERVIRQEAFIEESLNRGNTYLPDGSCPGPVEISLTDDITLVIFDAQWYLHHFEKAELDGDCDIEDEGEMFILIEDALRRNRGKKVIFATHHPLYSVGMHGGYFPFRDNLFPLLEFNNWMYIPLPGFIYTGYRKYFGHLQDIPHPEYKALREKLLEIMQKYPDVIYAAGHEHNLQYLHISGFHHIISGGGGEGTHIARKENKAGFAFEGTGFCKLSFYDNGDVWMEFIHPDDTEEGSIVFRKKLFNKMPFDPERMEEHLQAIDYSDSSVRVRTSQLYNKGKFVRFMMGDNYRDVWNAEVALPVFDIGKKKGGLKILKRGGGQQTHSVRLADDDGKEYVLRSVNKFVDKALDENLQQTIAVDVVQDGISASHPYAALTVPMLADAAGVMHTNPEIVWVPDDPRLGIYREEMANGIFLFEERPDDNREDVASFGRSKDIKSTSKTIKKTEDEHDHFVDQQAVLRARLFDILINDWDRHDDQWRWAKFDVGEDNIYKPIPRDRDQVYFVNEGLVMWLAARDWVQRKFQGFDHEIEDVVGLGFNSRYFDRYFLSEPGLEDWLRTAEELKEQISDSVIHAAILELPPEVYELSGQEIEEKLRSRRDALPRYAEEFYGFLAKTVDVLGTDERDYFEVKRLEDGITVVDVYAMSDKKGRIKQKLYHRVFKPAETREIRLYGLKDEDLFKISGKADAGIRVRIIPGKDEDKIVDESFVSGPGKKTLVYERKDKKNKFETGKETRLILSRDKSIDNYERKQFKFNKTIPVISAGYNIDDGIFLGGGVHIKRYNFRDSSMHKISAHASFRTGASALDYDGLISSFSRTFDLEITAGISLPRNVDNYFGMGNNTSIPNIDDHQKYYRVRYEYAWVNPRLKHTISDVLSFSFGPFYEYYNLTDTSNRFIGELYPAGIDSLAFAEHHYTGLKSSFFIDTRDDDILPQRGIYWETRADGYYSIAEKAKNFIKLQSDISFYLSFRKDPRLVFALRFGGAANIGDYEFYHANYLGGKSNLRGFRSNRYAGERSFYQNTEIRLKLANIRSYVFNGQAGLMFFNDVGRVWIDKEKSAQWHDGYGAGIWFTPFEFTAITITYSRSNEDDLLNLNMHFSF